MIKKTLFSIIFILLFVSTALADKTLVDITLELSNIAIKDHKAPGPNNQSATSSFSTWGFIQVNDPTQSLFNFSFPYEEMDKYVDEVARKYKGGRRIKIKYEIVNYQPTRAIFSDINKGYHLFDLTWFTEMLLFKYRKMNGDWIQGHYRPEHEYSESPSEATISGYGDYSVIMPPHYKYDVSKPLTLFNVQEVIRNINYRIINYQYETDRALYIDLNDDKLIGEKLTITGKAVLGDSAIHTERNPFWYPWDKYSFSLLYKSSYPSDVTIEFKEIEDLDISISRNFEFVTAANKTKEITGYFYRSTWFRNIILNIILALSPLFLNLLNKKRWRLETKRGIRLGAYIFILIAILTALPLPLNVPKINFLNLITFVIFTLLVIALEFYPLKKPIKHRIEGNKTQT